MTKPERMCADALEVLEIKYQQEYRFPDCRNALPLPFDFYIPELNACIEYDGICHYKPIYGEDIFEKVQRRDAIKTKYCQDNGIKLLRIPYTRHDHIADDIVAFVEKLLDV
jgi:very-short-patch-repair endonuclease